MPFSNRWRTIRRDWNPLLPPSRGVGMVQRVLDFLKPQERLWSWTELASWLPLVRSEGVLHHGVKTLLASLGERKGVCTPASLAELFVPD